MKRRHSEYRLLCDFCKDDFGGKINGAKDSNWEEFRDHIYKVFFTFVHFLFFWMANDITVLLILMIV